LSLRSKTVYGRIKKVSYFWGTACGRVPRQPSASPSTTSTNGTRPALGGTESNLAAAGRDVRINLRPAERENERGIGKEGERERGRGRGRGRERARGRERERERGRGGDRARERDWTHRRLGDPAPASRCRRRCKPTCCARPTGADVPAGRLKGAAPPLPPVLTGHVSSLLPY